MRRRANCPPGLAGAVAVVARGETTGRWTRWLPQADNRPASAFLGPRSFLWLDNPSRIGAIASENRPVARTASRFRSGTVPSARSPLASRLSLAYFSPGTRRELRGLGADLHRQPGSNASPSLPRQGKGLRAIVVAPRSLALAGSTSTFRRTGRCSGRTRCMRSRHWLALSHTPAQEEGVWGVTDAWVVSAVWCLLFFFVVLWVGCYF